MTKTDAATSISGRRPLLKAAAGGAVALGVVGAASRIALHPGDDPPSEQGESLVLSGHRGSDVRSLDLRLGDDVLPRVSPGQFRTRQLPTSRHSMVAFTWARGSEAPQIRIRSRIGGAWQAWQNVPQLHDAPDPDTGEGGDTTGTDLVWIGESDGIQVKVDGGRPADLTLVLLHPARRAADTLVSAPLERRLDTESEATSRVAMPRMFSRGDWGANESWRDGSPSFNSTIKQVHVHHTVNANSYARGDVAGLIRGMYRYHTHNLGWSDIGYNFLVDRFGRIWVGRAGGATRPVRGAHTLGFNHDSTGVSVIGNFEVTPPSQAVLNGVAAVAAWKLDAYGRSPRGQTRVRSTGSDRYGSGRTVRLPVIDGHRDTNLTACPGRYLYAALPKIRRRAGRIVRRGGGGGSEPTPTSVVVDAPATLSGAAVLGQVLTVGAGSYRPADATVKRRWLRNGKPIRGARGTTYTCRPRDVGQRLSCRVGLSKDGLETVTQTTSPTGAVEARAVIVANTTVGRRSVVVRVRVDAPRGVTRVPSGQVNVTFGGRTRKVRLTNGSGRVRFGGRRGMRAGTYRLVVVYPGDGLFNARRVKDRVRFG